MKAFSIDRYGKDSLLRFGDSPEPDLRTNDILIEVRAASVNQLDVKIISGEFKQVIPHRLPLTLGHDLSGVVIATGPEVSRFQVGDAVYGCLPVNRIGAFAERVAVDEAFMAPKPDNITFEEAASVPVVALTAWQAFLEISKVQPGQKVFIQAGSGGVGVIAIQLAKNLGAFVATTASAASAQKLEALGADVVIDYRSQSFADVLTGYDVALMSQDEASLIEAIRILKPGGVAISISGPPDPGFAKQAGLSPVFGLILGILSRRVRATARKARVAYHFLFMRPGGEQLRLLNPLLESGAIRPVLDRVFPFDQTLDAVAYIKSGRAKGKVVVKVS